jgi:hypothetical protein
LTAAALVIELRSRGIELVAVGDRLRFRPASRVPPELLVRLRERKAEVLALLSGDSAPRAGLAWWYAYPWPDSLPGLGVRHVGPYEPCSECGEGSWVRYGGRVLCARDSRARSLKDPEARFSI